MRVQQTMGEFAQGFVEEVLIELLDFGIEMRFAKWQKPVFAV